MSQKTNPYLLRLGYNKDWNNFYFPENKNPKFNWLKRDKIIRDYFYYLFPEQVRLKIEYVKNLIFIYLYLPEISLLLEEKNTNLEKIIKNLYLKINDDNISIKLNLVEITVYNSAQSISNLISDQLKKRSPFRFVLRSILTKIALEREIKGAKIQISGRLDGSEIAQRKKWIQGKIPLSTFDSNIDFGFSETTTAYGKIGIQVQLYKGIKNNYVNT